MTFKKTTLIFCAIATLICSTNSTIDASAATYSLKNAVFYGSLEMFAQVVAPLTMMFIAFPVVKSIKKKKHRAPVFVQEQAQVFFKLLAKSRYDHFSCWLKKKLGYLKVYQGARQDIFKELQNTVAISHIYNGIDFPANTFCNDTLTNTQLATLCHEVVHVFYGDTFKGGDRGSKIWYKCEYQAEYKTVEIMYELGLYEVIEEMVIQRVLEISKEGYMQKTHPYILGTINAFYTLFKDHPELIKNETVLALLEAYIDVNFKVASWQKLYEVYKSKQISLQQATATPA